MRGILLLALITSALAIAAVASPNASRVAAAANPTTQPAPVVSVTTLPALPSAAPSQVTPPSTALPAPPGSVIELTGVPNPRILTLKDLQSMRRSSVTLRIQDPDGRRRVHTFTGVLMHDIVSVDEPKGAALRKYVVVTGLNNASTIVAFPEFDPDFNNKQILVAYLIDGQPLPTPGIAELVVPEDATSGRFIGGITKIAVNQVAP